ncbi:hypothetical protein [Actinacidiphila glaucinigra]|uniref:Uncharacterized protein n=1 Tax=Actinacidiphila glaucinigra TaxID=235986 RepID=A0A239F0M9_9ACTN|nr:hypothetical protein [Actinacidiphila glaucinigra]SNS50088.1 hypothetical protein SAMN05216252_106236 [Actinacidiphila glaucinigra]
MDCDFCNLPGVARWKYVLSPDRPVVGLTNGAGDAVLFDDDGIWHACIACAALVDREDMAGLIERVCRALGAVLPLKDTEHRQTVQALMVGQYSAVMQSTTVKLRA